MPADGTSFDVVPIATVTSSRTEAIDDDWDAVQTTITLLAPFGPDAVAGLDAFSHLEVVYLFHLVDPATVHTGARVPRAIRRGLPSASSPSGRRTGRTGSGCRRASSWRWTAPTLRVRGLDAVDGTPIIDLKPYMSEFAPRTAVRQPAWSRELMAGYW